MPSQYCNTLYVTPSTVFVEQLASNPTFGHTYSCNSACLMDSYFKLISHPAHNLELKTFSLNNHLIIIIKKKKTEPVDRICLQTSKMVLNLLENDKETQHIDKIILIEWTITLSYSFNWLLFFSLRPIARFYNSFYHI